MSKYKIENRKKYFVLRVGSTNTIIFTDIDIKDNQIKLMVDDEPVCYLTDVEGFLKELIFSL